MTDKYEWLRKDLSTALAEAGAQKRGNFRAQMVADLLADRDAKHTALELVRMSAGWQCMSDETRQVVIAALTQGEQNGN